jgi:hypothetical protein
MDAGDLGLSLNKFPGRKTGEFDVIVDGYAAVVCAITGRNL